MGAAGRIGLSGLSIFNAPRQPRILAVLKGYFDDSRTEGQIWTVAGYVGDETQWENYEQFWDLALRSHDRPYFHMKEMADPTGPFKDWLALTPQAVEAKAAFFGGLIQVLRVCGLQSFGASIRISDLNRFNRETNANLQPYPLAVYSCMIGVAQKFPDVPVELFFDRVEKVDSKLATAREYVDSDSYYMGICDQIVTIPLAKGLTFRNVTPLQAADFAAWELRKNHLNMDEWFAIEGKPIEWNARWAHLKAWCLDRFGTALPPARISFVELFSTNKPDGIVWDHRAMQIAHEARLGVWA